MSTKELPSHLETFAKENNLIGLTQPSIDAIYNKESGYTIEKGRSFLKFQEKINTDLLKHSVIVDNKYTAWFAEGDMNPEQLKAFVIQFSVFSNLFLIAQLKKMINADSIEAMRASKEILANEIGVVFNTGNKISKKEAGDVSPDYVSEAGTVEGGVFHFKAGHFEWLLRVGEALGLGFNDLGKRQHGTEPTLFFCDELSRLYGSENYAISQAASYAVENWAAAGFWDELVKGFEHFNKQHNIDIPVGFFSWHARIEGQHAEHTQEELEEYYFERQVDEEIFIKYGNEMLKGVHAFWQGLDDQRKELV